MRGRGMLVVLLALACGRAPAPVLAPVSASAAAVVAPAPDAVAEVLRRLGADSLVPADVRALYLRRGFEPLFASPDDAAALIDTLTGLSADGLDYTEQLAHARRLQACDTSADSLAALDILLTNQWLSAARALAGHRINPPRVDPLWAMVAEPVDAVAALESAARAGTVAAALSAFRPSHPQYLRLRAALAREARDPERLRRIVLSLERWRWMPRALPPAYVLVNIPAFELQLVRPDTTIVHRVILGRLEWATPLLAGAITRVVLAPRWGVPREIARREIVPVIRRDTGYLARHGILVYGDAAPATPVDPLTVDWTAADSLFPYRLIQLPGPSNPLGRVKLTFDNPFDVALHDTPALELFGSPDRALSHGCVRVDGALALAGRLLGGGNEWDEARLARLAAEGTTRTVRLPQPVPVFLTYFTAWADGSGAVYFLDDVYGWDARLEAALDTSHGSGGGP